MRSRRVEFGAAALTAALLLPPSVLLAQEVGGTAARTAATGYSSEQQLAAILRRARSEEESSPLLLAQQAAALGPECIAASLHLLERERVPALEPEQTEQLLSQPQREILLAGLALQEQDAVLAALDDRLALAVGPVERLLALRVLGAVGDESHLEDLGPLALGEDEEAPPPGLEQALRESLAGILRRQPQAYDHLPRLLRLSPAALQGTWITASADSGSPRALELCSQALALSRELAPVAAAQVLRVGRSSDPQVNRELVGRLRWLLDPAQPGLCRSVMLALGELRDYESIPVLIELLDDSDAGLASNALWALQRMTGLSFPGSSDRWRRWYADELAWFAYEERVVLRKLGSPDPARVSEALREIGRRRTQREDLAIEVLAVLERAEPSLRTQACDTLGTLGAEVALPHLIERMESDIPYCAQAAWRALGVISGRELPAEGRAWREALALGA